MALERDLNELRIDRTAVTDAPRSRWWIWVVVLLVVGAGALFFLRPRAVAVRTAAVTESAQAGGGPATVLNASGYVTARRRAVT